MLGRVLSLNIRAVTVHCSILQPIRSIP